MFYPHIVKLKEKGKDVEPIYYGTFFSQKEVEDWINMQNKNNKDIEMDIIELHNPFEERNAA